MVKRKRGEARNQIYEMIKKKGTTSLTEIATLTKINYNTIRSSVIGLTKAGLIERIGRGQYRSK